MAGAGSSEEEDSGGVIDSSEEEDGITTSDEDGVSEEDGTTISDEADSSEEDDASSSDEGETMTSELEEDAEITSEDMVSFSVVADVVSLLEVAFEALGVSVPQDASNALAKIRGINFAFFI